ncbi:MAG: response regulator [Chloroflexi bacterium]|nr:MAG: response regulator [Chloroflexota bacterium]TMF15882.1 MAG: response regulator [Chloroflexota bacterium]
MDDEIKVLLIEDDEAAAEMYRLRMTADGYTVIIARDGQEGLALAESEQPDLVYLDLRLPKMDGLEVLKRLRETAATAAVPVVILTNHGEPELRERGLELGALEFLIKADTTPAYLSQGVERWTEVPLSSLEA